MAASLAAVSLAASASPTAASVTIGQTAPSVTSCVAPRDFLQPTVTSGNTYVVPELPPASALVITSWSTEANAGGGMLAMKVYRQLGPTTYMAVGHDGPRPLTGSALNTFTGISVPVKAGDVLGNSVPPSAGGPRCSFDVSGETFLFGIGNLADGESGEFESTTNSRINVSAVVAPDNRFTLGDVARNKKKGTATLTVNVPNPGELTAVSLARIVNAAGVAVISKAVTPGTASLRIKATGKKKRKLNRKGKAKVTVAITYTPTGGDPRTQSQQVRLKKKLKKKL